MGRERFGRWLISVLFSLLAGLLLAALSVPAAAYAAQRWGAFSSGTPLARYESIVRLRDGELYRVTDRRAAMRAGPGWLRPFRVRSSEYVPRGSELARFLHGFHYPPGPDPRPLFLRQPPPSGYQEASGASAGWPWHAGHSRTDTDHTSRPGQTITRGEWSVALGGRDYVLPYLPHWSGLLANTIFYGLLVLLPRAGLRFARSAHRRHRSACATCGYPLDDGMERCPECGNARPAATPST